MMDRGEPKQIIAAIDKSVRGSSGRNHDVAITRLDLRVVDEELSAPGVHDEDFFVRMAMQARTVPLRCVDQN